MARLQADVDFKASVTVRLRELGHEVQTAVEAGIANQELPDDALLAFSTASGRALLTHNRGDFVRLHRTTSTHGGIIACKQSGDPAVLAEQIHAALSSLPSTNNLLIRVYLKSPPRIDAKMGDGDRENP